MIRFITKDPCQTETDTDHFKRLLHAVIQPQFQGPASRSGWINWTISTPSTVSPDWASLKSRTGFFAKSSKSEINLSSETSILALVRFKVPNHECFTLLHWSYTRIRLLAKLKDESTALTSYGTKITNMFANGIVDGFSDKSLAGNVVMFEPCWTRWKSSKFPDLLPAEPFAQGWAGSSGGLWWCSQKVGPSKIVFFHPPSDRRNILC